MSKIISVNAGSSSLKFQLYEMSNGSEDVVTSGVVERIGLSDAIFTIKVNGEKQTEVLPILDHAVAVKMLLDKLVTLQIVASLDEIDGVGHRVVHGGEYFNASVIVDADVEEKVVELSDLAPLHNPANLVGYRAFKEALSKAKHVFVFDTAFHQTMSEDVYMYPIPYSYYTDLKIRRYGFHGTSHDYVSKRTAELIGKDVKEANTIICHLGNGASISAIQGGKSVNTSMGFTPLAGVMMGTRSGDVDPSIMPFIMEKEGLSSQEVLDILNKKSGMLGISDISNDARDIENACKEGNPRAILTSEIYANRIAATIGSYFIQLGHVDAIAFTAGIGENDTGVREAVCTKIAEAMGVVLNQEINRKSRGVETLLSTSDSKIQVWLVPTNEELVIARDTKKLLSL